MKTQKIKVTIEVPKGDFCEDENHDVCRMFDQRWECIAFDEELDEKDDRPVKCQACLDACANDFQRGLDELSEGLKK